MTYKDLTSQKHERLARELNGGQTYSPNGTPDPYDQAQHRADVLQGRDRDAWMKWRRVMSYHGFIWMEAPQLDACPYVGPEPVVIKNSHGSAYAYRRHRVGQWRRWGAPRSKHINREWFLAFTMDDLLSLHQTPESFDAWIRVRDDRLRAKHLGFDVLPDSLRKPKYKAPQAVQVSEDLIVNQPAAPDKRPNQRPIDEPIKL